MNFLTSVEPESAGKSKIVRRRFGLLGPWEIITTLVRIYLAYVGPDKIQVPGAPNSLNPTLDLPLLSPTINTIILIILITIAYHLALLSLQFIELFCIIGKTQCNESA